MKLLAALTTQQRSESLECDVHIFGGGGRESGAHVWGRLTVGAFGGRKKWRENDSEKGREMIRKGGGKTTPPYTQAGNKTTVREHIDRWKGE